MANIVQTTLYWPDGNITQKVIDMEDPKQRRRFAVLANKCLRINGESVCIGKNSELADLGKKVIDLRGEEKAGS